MSAMRSGKHSIVVAVMLCVLGSTAIRAGDLDPPNKPRPTMHTLEEIYQLLQATQQDVIDTQQEVMENQQRLDTIEQQLTSEVPAGMVLISGGGFVMGDTFGEGVSDELPLRMKVLDSFYMDEYEVTKALWDEVYDWAATHGYEFANPGSGKAADHPVQTINWYDCVKWANARSAKEGLSPCYRNPLDTDIVYSIGEDPPVVHWWRNGYRLPTEAEWEKAARGGVPGTRFPWADVNTIQHTRANYDASPSSYSYDTNPSSGYHPAAEYGAFPYTSPVGSFAPNGYGLYDMAGNVYEWCWDWYGSDYYETSPNTNPRGPASGSGRVRRGGYWNYYAVRCRVAARNYYSPGNEFNNLGFRLVRAAQ